MRHTLIGIALASGALLVTGTASAQRGYNYHAGGNSFYQGGGNVRHYNPGHYRPSPPSRHHNNQRRSSSRNAELAVGALVVGGILGYALSQSNTPSQPQANTYYQPPPAPNYQDSYYGGATPGYVAPPVQSWPQAAPVYAPPAYQPQPVQAAPVYPAQPVYHSQPVYQQPGQPQYQYQTINGRTYYRPMQ